MSELSHGNELMFAPSIRYEFSFVLDPSDVADVVVPRYEVWLMPGAALM
jgi:hypothetical protein